MMKRGRLKMGLHEIETGGRGSSGRLGVAALVQVTPAPAGAVGFPATEPSSPAGELPAPEYVDQTTRRPRRTDLEIEAEAALGHHWVTLLGVERPCPRFFGDNLGMLPVWVESNADWRQAGRAFDLQQAAARAVRLAVLGVPSEAHAVRLKKALDEALHGRADESGAPELRHRFKNAVDLGGIDEWWPPLLEDAVMTCLLGSTSFETFGRDEHERMVQQRVAALARARARGMGT